MGKLFNTFLKYRYIVAGALIGVTVPAIKLSADYFLFNPKSLGPAALLLSQLRMPQQLLDYTLLTAGPIFVMTLLGFAYTKVISMKSIAFKDPLTGAFNKRYLQETENRLKKKKDMFTLAMIDLDNFKPINDKFGHQAGDEALRKVYKIFEEEKRLQDTIVRYGGDEFVMILPSTGVIGAKKLLNRIREKVGKITYGDINLGFSLGVVLERGVQQIKLQDLIKIADKRMYKDKAKKHMRYD